MMDDDFDMEGLSLTQARSYVADFMATQTQTHQQLQQAENNLATWKKRVSLAADRGETDLAREALGRAEESHATILRLRREAHEIDFKVLELKRKLAELQKQPQMSIDAGALLEQMESLVGPDHQTNEAVADIEAEMALDALKKRMESDPSSQE